MHILLCRHIWAELSILFWTFLSGTFFPGGGGGGGGGGGCMCTQCTPLRTRLTQLLLISSKYKIQQRNNEWNESVIVHSKILTMIRDKSFNFLLDKSTN